MGLDRAVLANALHQASGAMFIVASAMFSSSNIVGSKILRSWDWPYFRLMGTASLCISISILTGLLSTGGVQALSCQRSQVKWVLARGLAGTLQFVLAVLAAAAGASVGDIGALSSINTVVAALLGRLFLGEPLGPWHVLAVGFSIAGAVLISSPWSDGGNSTSSMLGYCLALLSGTSFGLMFICSRKAGKTSTWLLTLSAMTQRGMVLWALPLTGVVDDATMHKVSALPWQVAGILLLLIFLTFNGNFLATAGAKRIPAAVSATLMTSVSMAVGYVAQVTVFHQPPSSGSLLGAFMMLLAAVTMAVARIPRRVVCIAEIGASPQDASGSLATFVASEFAEQQATPEEVLPISNETPPTLRLRSLHLAESSKGAHTGEDAADSGPAHSLSLPSQVTLGATMT